MEGIIRQFYDAASIQRWNDHVRPVEFTELDKQAHKATIAYIIAKMEEEIKPGSFNWVNLIKGSLFEFLYRTILTDIKPAVFHRMMQAKGDELNKWVFEKIEKDISSVNNSLMNDFKNYFQEESYSREEKKILKAAHYLATRWEFNIIYNSGHKFYGIEKTKINIENELEDHYGLTGVQKIALGKKTYGFVDLCGQLRFQKRWAQSPRIPETSVLGHMLIVAFMSYLFSIRLNACDKRIYNNFYCALFHDLPEVLTRDIISPIKTSVEGLEEIILEYEKIQLDETILPLLPFSWHSEFKYLLYNQFDNRIIDPNGKLVLDIDENNMSLYNEDQFNSVDGKMIKACDHLAAFVETSLSISHGIKSAHLIDGHKTLKNNYKNKKISNIDFWTIFQYFELNDNILQVK